MSPDGAFAISAGPAGHETKHQLSFSMNGAIFLLQSENKTAVGKVRTLSSILGTVYGQTHSIFTDLQVEFGVMKGTS